MNGIVEPERDEYSSIKGYGRKAIIGFGIIMHKKC